MSRALPSAGASLLLPCVPGQEGGEKYSMSASSAQPPPKPTGAQLGGAGGAQRRCPPSCPFNMEEPGQNYGSQRPAPPALPGLRAQRRTPGAVVPPQPRLCGQGRLEGRSAPKFSLAAGGGRGGAARQPAIGAPGAVLGQEGDPRCWGLGVTRLGVPSLGGLRVPRLGGGSVCTSWECQGWGARGAQTAGGSGWEVWGVQAAGCRGFRMPGLEGK